MSLRIWQGLLPRGAGAPRLQYVAPRKGPKAEELTLAVMKEMNENRVEAEAILDLHERLGNLPALYRRYGLKVPRKK